jgi:hypothetical protein
MVAQVCLGKVGAVAAREVSRFARNSRDWQQLIEMCRVVDTVLVDQETVYAPRHGNDRLLLGLKGSLNEYELDLLRQRSLACGGRAMKRTSLPLPTVSAAVHMSPIGTSRHFVALSELSGLRPRSNRRSTIMSPLVGHDNPMISRARNQQQHYPERTGIRSRTER